MKPKKRDPVQLTSFKTSDGKMHEDLQKADEHQEWLDFFDWCGDNICRGGEWSYDMVAKEIWSHFRVKVRKD